MKPVFTLFTLASKELVHFNVDDQEATNFVSALATVREKFLLVHGELFKQKTADFG